jgi:hypothetical protein
MQADPGGEVLSPPGRVGLQPYPAIPENAGDIFAGFFLHAGRSFSPNEYSLNRTLPLGINL